MHAWLLLLAVLATFQTFVQVASTEDISSRFIAAISPQTVSPSHTTQAATKLNTKTTALMKAFNKEAELNTKSAAATKTFTYENSVSDNSNKNINNNNNNNTIIEIKNIIEIDNNQVYEMSEAEYNQVPEQRTSRTNQLEIFYNKNLVHKKTDNNNNKNKNLKNNHNNSVHNLVKETNETYEMAVKENTSLATTTTTKTTVEHKHKHPHHQHHHHHHHQHQQQQQQHSHHEEQQQQHTQAVTKTSHKLSTSEGDSSRSRSSNSSSRETAQTALIPKAQHQQQLQMHDVPETSSTAMESVSVAATATAVAENVAEESEANNANAVIDEDEPATYSNKEILSEKVKPDPKILVEIENSLLSIFNMKRPPKIDRSKIIIPEEMKEIYAQIMEHQIDSVNIPRPGLLTKSANTVRSFTHQDSKIDDRFPHHHRFRLHFDIKSIPAEEKLKAAELQLKRDAISNAALNPHQANRTRYQVLVYDITRVGIRGKREPSYLLLDNKTIRLNSTEKVSLDVQPAVQRWLASPKRNYGLLIEVRTMRALKPAPHHHVRLRRSTDEPHEDWQHKQPLLLTYTDDERHKSRSIRDVSTRSKRAQHHRRSHRRKNTDEICRRYPLYVDFADVGWSDWIVAPQGYDAYYCRGKCPFPLAEHLNSTNHAVVQTLVNNMNPRKVPKPCCVPTQLEGISMLYLNDQSTVVVKNYQDMAVVGCGCR